MEKSNQQTIDFCLYHEFKEKDIRKAYPILTDLGISLLKWLINVIRII